MFSVDSQGAVDVVQLEGPLTEETVESLSDSIERGLSGGLPMVVLNMAHVPLLDSAGLEGLLDAREKVALRGGTVKLAGLNPLCQEVLRVTQVGSHFQSFSGTKAAVGSFVQ